METTLRSCASANDPRLAFSGLISCGKCGCSVVGELKNQRYVYYHWTSYAAPDSRFLRILEHLSD